MGSQTLLGFVVVLFTLQTKLRDVHILLYASKLKLGDVPVSNSSRKQLSCERTRKQQQLMRHETCQL